MTVAMTRVFSSLVDLVSARSADAPETIGYRFLANGEEEQQTLTYAALFDDARTVGCSLIAAGVAPGDRVLLLCPSGLDYLRAFFGCLAAGAIAVPASPRPNRSMRRLASIVADSGARTAIVVRAAAPRIELGGTALQPLEIDLLRQPAQPPSVHLPAVEASTPAMLQYTSGSTGRPKGVLLTHGQLLANQKMIQAALKHGPGSVFVTWLPLFHDMGLIGAILQPLYCGIPCVLMTPLHFFQRPVRWLRAISRFRGTTSGAPNFAYEHCVRRISDEEKRGLDLSSWDVAFNGAEPVRSSTMQRFAAAFAGSGFRRQAFYPCYGLAEAALMVTGGTHGEGVIEDADGRPSCGRALTDSEVIAVDPVSRRPVADGVEGELWVRSGSVATGYWQRTEETEAVFHATLSDGTGPYLRTGDLAVLRDGQVFVTGRAKDILIIRGANLHPEDVEYAASAMAAPGSFPPTAAFTVAPDQDARLVVVQEAARGQGTSGDRQIAAVRGAVAQECGVECWTIVLVRAGSLPLTTSGKVERLRCREAFEAGTLDEVSRSVAPDELARAEADDPRDQLQTWIAGRLGMPAAEIPRTAPLIELGLDSLGAQIVQQQLFTRFGIDLALEDFFEGASIDSWLARVSGRGRSAIPPAAASTTPDGWTPASAQRAMWFFEQSVPGSTAYVVERALDAGFTWDPARVAAAHGALLARHDWLRAAFAVRDGELGPAAAPGRMVWPSPGCEVVPDGRRLTFRVHHALADLPSFLLALEDFCRLYQGVPLPAAPAGPGNLGAAEREWLGSDDAGAQLQYWTTALRHAPSALRLAPARSAPARMDFRAGRHTFPIGRGLTDALRALAKRQGTTLFVLLLAAWKLLLARYSGERDVVVGSPFSVRGPGRAHGGCLVNPVALRTSVDPDRSLTDLLRTVHQVTIGAVRHARYPFAELAARLLPDRRGSHMPFFNVMFAHVDAGPSPGLNELAMGVDGPAFVMETVSLRPADSPPQHVYADLHMGVAPSADGLCAALTFRADLFADAAAGIAHAYVELLEAVAAAAPHDPVARLLEGTDKERTVVRAARQRPAGVVAAIEATARTNPQATAVIDAEGHTTYGELLSRVDRLAARLDRAIGPEATVGVCLPRRIDAVVALLAVLKAGGVYLPLDAKQPTARLRELARRSSMRVLIARDPALVPDVPLLSPDESLAAPSARRTFAAPPPGSLAYMMSTSGTTGAPKLVEIEHAALDNAIAGLAQRPGFGSRDRFLATTTGTFDVSLAEVLLPLTTGGAVVMAEPALLLDAAALDRTLRRAGVTHAQATPSGWRSLLDSGWAGSQDVTLWTVGEPLTPQLARRMLARGRTVWNLYGPTEATIYATAHEVRWSDAREGSLVPIGTPLHNITVSLTQHGSEGELMLGGAGVARGYRDDARATAERFVPGANGRTYTTGDLVRCADGRLLYVGRVDRQVKIRGMRVEPAELEAALLKLPGVRDAVVVVENGHADYAELVAFVEGAPADAMRLKSILRTSLPAELIPARVTILPSFPRTANGKIARDTLAAASRAEAGGDSSERGAGLHAPSQDGFQRLESLVTEAWASVLGVDRPAADANFFDLGGHSLLLPRLRHELHARLDRTVSIDELLAYSTIRTLTRHLHGRSTPDAAPAERDVERLAARRELLRDAGR